MPLELHAGNPETMEAGLSSGLGAQQRAEDLVQWLWNHLPHGKLHLHRLWLAPEGLPLQTFAQPG